MYPRTLVRVAHRIGAVPKGLGLFPVISVPKRSLQNRQTLSIAPRTFHSRTAFNSRRVVNSTVTIKDLPLYTLLLLLIECVLHANNYTSSTPRSLKHHSSQ